jgi:DNA segregation ATPase FtsK/SpoIIIE-like protein
MDNQILIDRPPRIQPELPFDQIEIPAPPTDEDRGIMQLIQMALPMVAILGLVFVTAGGGGRSSLIMIPMLLSVVATVGLAFYSYNAEKAKRARIRRTYRKRLLDLTKEMHNYHDQQRRFYRYNYPDVRTVWQIADRSHQSALANERPLRAEARLWERRTTDHDFGFIRLGMGALPSTVLYTLGQAENQEDELVREAVKLHEDAQYVDEIPVVISLRRHATAPGTAHDEGDATQDDQFPHCPTTHALGIAGEDAEDVYEFVRSLVAHYAVFHQPDDARLYVLGAEAAPWRWLAGLPHAQAEEPTTCFISELGTQQKPNPLADENRDQYERFLEGLRRLLSTRKIRLQDREERAVDAGVTLPQILVIIDLLHLPTTPATGATDEQPSRLATLEADAAISILLEEGEALGAAVIFLTPERAKVPSRCTAIIEIERTTPASSSRLPQLEKIHFRYTETGVNSTRYVGTADYVRHNQMPDLINLLARLKVQQGYGANVPATVPFLSLMEKASLDHLLTDTAEQWRLSALADERYCNWLRARIGIMSGNKGRTLTFAANRDGVHGMVAGSTGSGKSELLISLITAMAVTYAPSVLNFVLVDYKGGGAFKGLEKFPHVVDIITNLQGDGVTRMFTAIQAELKRRQKLNADTKTKNIVDYRRRELHLTREPYPFLFIIIDEFAEMIADRPEYKKELESITRVGRAQGVSLILAAQRPTGVTDQMRSNIKFRICLRVETTGESREMLRREDAAYLPGNIPGRGYLQVGNDEIELIQVAYTGDKYRDPKLPIVPVLWPDRNRGYDERVDQEPPELYQVIGERLSELAVVQGIPAQGAPWPDPLPTHLTLTDPLFVPMTVEGPISGEALSKKAITSSKYLQQVDRILLGAAHGDAAAQDLMLNPALNRWLNGEPAWVIDPDWAHYAMRPVVGLVDDPVGARQLPLIVNLLAGHVAIFGGAGWGKTTMLRSLMISLAATYSPDHLHLYLLDLGGGSLGNLKELPHVGAVIAPDAPGYQERVDQLMRQLEEFVEDRKRLLNEADSADIYEYYQLHPTGALPSIVVVIDNFVEFRETFAGRDDGIETALDKVLTLARQSKAYGIHFVITATRPSDVPYQLFNMFTERYTFKLADPTEYRGIVGGAVAEFTGLPGRGYGNVEGTPLAFQIAQPFAGRQRSESDGERTLFEQFVDRMRRHLAESGHAYRQPIRIDALPEGILFKDLFARSHAMAVERATPAAEGEPAERVPELSATYRAALHTVTARNWQQSLDPAAADWLAVTIGVISGNRLRELQLEAKRDGVHGLIAGGTGAGKSELLMTLVVGLALRYDPSVLNFVLVDYKGGGAFQPFAELPHVVDLVTNLNKSAVRRMFTAINAEIQRRQQLNAETGTKDIVEYRAKGLHRERPYPHLFIIIDEYAEMISESPEFKAELESIARVGRSSGVNLLLAAQRPTGITDQMRANIKYRICLRVEELETSREMLRRPDAALLPNGMPGRGYLQVGNEGVELIQVAYTGESYQNPTDADDGRPQKFYDIAVALANALLQGEAPNTPWPRPLPKRLTLLSPQLARYRHADYHHLLTLGRAIPDTRNEQNNLVYALNPFVHDWLAGRSAWHGIDWETAAMRAIIGIVDDPHNACQLPLVVDLTKGHWVLFGASGWGKTTFLRTLVTSLATTHSPDEFQAHVLDLGGRNLDVLKQLPHVGTIIMPDEKGYEERVQQLLRELNDEVTKRKAAFSAVNAQTLYEYNQRQAHRQPRAQVAFSTAATPSPGPFPAILVLVDNFAEYLDTFGGHEEDETNPLEMLIALIRQAKPYGLHFIVTATRLNVLSNKLLSLFAERLTLRLTDVDEYRAIVGGQVGEIDEAPGRGYVKIGRMPLEFQTAVAVGEFKDGTLVDLAGHPLTEFELIQQLGDQMTRHGAHQWSGRQPLRIDALDRSSSYRDLLKRTLALRGEAHFLDELARAAQARWQTTATAAHADWLSTTLGVTSGGRARTLHFSAKTDGVHGLIAGGTGSGKSELLMTLIVGLALNYSPDILNFVLVDYKGGGTFQPFRALPHCVDVITNLNKAGVNRMFTAINAEMRRRQRLNAETGTKDIIEYRQKGLHLNGGQPYPHLFVIIDEYAEMISDNPDYRLELESITRVGRAQGVNLILASQRPTGVSDQMRANIKLRICLRVEETETSQEMLRRKDAAYLPSIPGRGYIQVGNENLELVQVSYAGEAQPDDRPPAVLWPERTATGSAALQAADDSTFFEAVVTLTRQLNGGKLAPRLWPHFLPEHFSLQSLLYDAQSDQQFVLVDAVTDWLNGETAGLWPRVQWASDSFHADVEEDAPHRALALRPVVGLIDDPAEARQYPLAFNLNRNHLAIHGDAGMGKTALLRSIFVSLAATHSPNELHTYILDLGGRGFAGFEHFPHVGAVLFADEESFDERLQRLLEKLEQLVEERQQLLSEAGASSFIDYNERTATAPLPAVLVLIDNFAELAENHELLLELTLMPLIRRATGVGIAFVVTANIPNSIPNKIYSLFGERITLKQNNADRYLDIVGRGAVEIGDIPGRGYRRVSGRPLMFHAALPVGLFEGQSGRDRQPEALQLERMARHMNKHVTESALAWPNRPTTIRTLEDYVALDQLLTEAADSGDSEQSRRIEAVLGRDVRLDVARFNLKRLGPHFAVVGPPLSGKTTVLYNLIFSLAQRHTPEQVALVLVDLQRRMVDYGGELRLDALPHVVQVVFEIEEMEALVERLKGECAALETGASQREIFVIIDDFDDFSDALESHRTVGRDLANLARRFGRTGLHVVIAGMLESSISELRRQVRAANYGIGLRTAQSLDTLGVMRRPAGLQDKELPFGRGYIVKSGQATMIQTASPYGNLPFGSETVSDEVLETQVQRALDQWVRRLVARSSGVYPKWAEADSHVGAPQQPLMDPALQRGLEVLHLLVQDQIKGANGTVDHAAVLAEAIKSIFGDEEAGQWIFTQSAEDVFNMAETMLETRATNKANPRVK